MSQPLTPSPRNRLLAGILAVVYAWLMALAFVLETLRIEDRWPVWLQWVVGLTWFAIMMVLPFLVVKYFFGIYLLPTRNFRAAVAAGAIQQIRRVPRNRPLAGLCCLAFAALLVLGFYLESIHIEDYWPTWALIVGGLALGAAMIVLPCFAVKYFFGITFQPASPRPRFSLRMMLLSVPVICLFVWMFTQLDWLEQRQRWRKSNSAAVRSTQEGQAPAGLVWLFDQGETRIELKNGTQEQIAEARRLFPEATVVVAGDGATE